MAVIKTNENSIHLRGLWCARAVLEVNKIGEIMDDIFTQEIKDLMKLATTDFDKFYKETEKQNKSSGDFSTAASSGDSSKAASSGDSSTAASSGDFSTAASSGDSSTAASSGNFSKAASSGDSSKAASSGNFSKAASSGYSSACSALGYRAAVKGDLGNLIMASEYHEKDGKLIPVGGKADIIDDKKLKAQCWYIVEGGQWVEVDYTDDVFNRVVSTKGNVKKLKDDNGNFLYVVTDGEKSAHGKTIKEARDSLVYKIKDRDKSRYEGLGLDQTFTVPEFIEMYRVITGACEYGVKAFVEGQSKIKKKYTVQEIINLTKGQFGHNEFSEFFKVKGKP